MNVLQYGDVIWYHIIWPFVGQILCDHNSFHISHSVYTMLLNQIITNPLFQNLVYKAHTFMTRLWHDAPMYQYNAQ